MRTVGTWLVLAGGLFLAPGLAYSQVQIQVQAGAAQAVFPRGFAPFGSKFMSLQNKAIQDDLKLTPEQLGKIKELAGKQQQLFKELQKNPKELGKKLQELNQENEKAADALLQPEQTKRLRQIAVQQLGEMAFRTPDIAAALKLSPEQNKIIADIMQDAQKVQRDISLKAASRVRTPTGFQDIQKLMTEQRQITIQVIVAILSPEQKQTWQELVGAPFTGQVNPRFGAGGIVIPQSDAVQVIVIPKS